MVQNLSAQETDQERAKQKAMQAIRLEDEQGKYDEAIALFEEAGKLDPGNINYPYEMAYAYSGKKEYTKATVILERLLQHKQVNARVYQALGNAYDYMGDSAKAAATYRKGMQQFPNAGELYLEMGNMFLVKEKYNEALSYYERGIEVDSKFPSNYYRASKIFLGTTEEVWGMLYGELFMNLERNTKRTEEISRLLYKTYKSEIKITSDTSYEVSFSKQATLNIPDVKDAKHIKLPFGMGCYEMILSLAIVNEKQINIESLNRIRSRFVDVFFSEDFAQKYPNILFDYQRKIKEAGHLEAYNHWILMAGDQEGFNKWVNNNKVQWDGFVQWFSEHRLILDRTHRFYRTQY